MRCSKYVVKNSSEDVVDNLIRDIMNQGKWFMDWDTTIDLERVLKKGCCLQSNSRFVIIVIVDK